MDPVMRIVLTVIGAYVGATFGGAGARIFDALIGAAVGFAIGDLGVLRARVNVLAEELARLRARTREVSPPSTDAAPVPAPTAAPTISAAPRIADALTAAASPAAVAPRFERPWRAADPHPEAPTTAPAPSRPPAIDEPPPAGSLIFDTVRRFFTGGNTLVRVGVVVLLFGVGFLLRYMAEHTHLPIEFRLSGIALAAIALLLFGWRLRTSRPGYALAVQGGAVGILYLLVFAAMRMYQLLPVPLAFFVLVALAVGSAALAVLQNSLSFALLGVTGGFLAPILASTGEGSHVVLFSYYAVLNAGILAIAWFKAWRPLNIAGFVFTFAIGAEWGVLKYRPEEFASTEPFLILFFLFYVGISVLFTLRQPPKLKGYVDGTLVFGTPLIAFGLQAGMLHSRLLELALSALAVSALYLSLAWLLMRRRDDTQRVLCEAFMALGIVFLTLAVPLALDVRWNAITWALEGAALVWVGCRQNRVLARIFGSLLIIAAGVLAAGQFEFAADGLRLPLERYYGILALTAAAIFAAQSAARHREQLRWFEQPVPPALFLWGLLFWLAGGLTEISQYMPSRSAAASLIFIALTAMCTGELRAWLRMRTADIVPLCLLPVMGCFAAAAIEHRHPFARAGWIAWPLSFAAWYRILYRAEGSSSTGATDALHTAAAWLLCLVASWECAWAVDHWVAGSDTWPALAWAAIAALALFSLPKLVTRIAWPFGRHRELYIFVVGTGFALYLGGWSLISNLAMRGDSAPLPYVPLLNPLDVAQALVLTVLLRYWLFLRKVRGARVPRLDPRIPLPALVALIFIWLNGVLLRTMHQWFAVPFELNAFVESTLVETALSIFWAFLALSTMLIAARKRWRGAWLAGAALIAVVIAKLFFVDLSRSGSIERIVSFVGVGLLMLVVGYFSPLPPSREEPA